MSRFLKTVFARLNKGIERHVGVVNFGKPRDVRPVVKQRRLDQRVCNVDQPTETDTVNIYSHSFTHKFPTENNLQSTAAQGWHDGIRIRQKEMQRLALLHVGGRN